MRKMEEALLEFVFGRIQKYYKQFNGEVDKDLHNNHINKLKEQYKKNKALLGNNLLLLKSLSNNIWKEFQNKNYDWRRNKADTLPFSFQHFSPWKITIFNSLTFSLRSKKNSRPIHFNFWKINWGSIGALMSACKQYLSPQISAKQKFAWLSKTLMPLVFTGKDDELMAQENQLTAIYKSYKNSLYCIQIKDFWDFNTIYSLLAKNFLTKDMVVIMRDNEKIKEEVLKVISDKAKELRNLNVFVDTFEEVEETMAFFKNKGYETKNIGKDFYAVYFEHYLKTYIYFEEVLNEWIVDKKKLTYTNLCKDGITLFSEFKNSQFEKTSLIADVYIKFHELDNKLVKPLYKNIMDVFNISYQEDVLNSFLTQPDLSNSLELCQDVYQEFLRGVGIPFDDMYINTIQADMIREHKNEKNQAFLKNVNWFSLTKK